jgi:hypothetical protein
MTKPIIAAYTAAPKAYDAYGAHTGPGPWLDLIHAVNRLEPKSFGSAYIPDTRDLKRWVEEYPEYTVWWDLDDEGGAASDVTVAAHTLVAAELLDRAAATVAGLISVKG